MQGNGKMDVCLGGNAVGMFNAKSLTELEHEKAVETHNKAVKEYEDIIKKQTEIALAKAKEVKAKAEAMDIHPINTYVLVRPYKKNPFEMMQTTETGLIIPEYNPTFKNPDSGELEEEVNLSVQADVLEVSPLCKFVKPGDIVYYRRASSVPIPFLRQGLEVVAETSIQVVINEGLKERFANLK